MAQLVTRLSEDLLAAVDRLIEGGGADSRSDAVRRGLARLIDEHRRAAVGRKIVEGYRDIPPTDDLDAWAETSGRALIEAEPW